MLQDELRKKHGEPSSLATNKVVPYMNEWVMEFIRKAPFAIMATADTNGNCDASPKGGKPGFIKVLDERHLIIPDIHGNRLFQSYANIDDNPHVGLIFMIPGWDYTARVNGTVRFVNKDELSQMGVDGEVFNPDEKAKTLQGLVLEVDEAYGHCPRALSFSKLWDSEQIEANRNVKPVGSPYK